MENLNSLCIGTKTIQFKDRNQMLQEGIVAFLENNHQLVVQDMKPSEIEGKIVHYISKEKGEEYTKPDGTKGKYATSGYLFQFVQSRVTADDLQVARLEALRAQAKAYETSQALANL
jgi:hypothetical protein